MSAPTFLEELRATVAKFQAVHPEREGELARAHALILHGMVVPSPDDPQAGQVLSSDGQKVYHVNGVCDCDAGQHGRTCKHVHSWRLYQYVQRKVEAQAEGTENSADNVRTVSTDTPQGLGEAPASANVRVQMAGREVQITLRDHDEARLLARLEAVLQRFPVAPQASSQPQAQLSPQQHNAAAMHRPVSGFCAVHNVEMKLNDKNGRQWFSHRTAEGQWCKGR